MNRFWNMAAAAIGTLTIAAITTTAAVAQEKKITLLIHPTVYAITGGATGIISRFEASSGIKVEVVTQPLVQLHEKALVEWIARSGRYDVVSALDSYIGRDVATQFLEPLGDRINALPASFDEKDIIGSLYDAVTINGKVYGVPFQGGAVMLFYRKDLFEKYKVKPPTTLNEMLVASRQIAAGLKTDKVSGVYAFGFRAKEANVGTQDFLALFFAAGGNLFVDGQTKCGLDSPAGVAAAKFLEDMAKEELMPKDTLAIGRDELIGGFQQGRLAMVPSFSPYYGQFNDPKTSKIVGQVGWAVMPTSEGVPPGRAFKNYWYLTIDRNSRNKDAAWQLIQALTAKEAQTEMAAKWAFGPVRRSAFASPQVQATFPHALDWGKAASASVNVPQHPEWPRIQDIIFEELTTILNRQQQPASAVARMCARINPILKKT